MHHKKKERHLKLTTHYAVRLVPCMLDGKRAFEWYVYHEPFWKGVAVASSVAFTVKKAKEDALSGLAVYLSK